MNNKDWFYSIAVDTEWNRWLWPKFAPLKLPHPHELSSIAPCVKIPNELASKVVEEFRKWNQELVNKILSEYY